MKSSLFLKFLGRPLRALAVTALALAPVSFTHAADIFWSGGTASYTNAAGWGGTVPGGADHAINNSGVGNVVQINAGNPDWTLIDLIAGNADNTSGAYVQNAATVKVGNPGGWFRFGVSPGSFGVYTLNAGTLNSIDQLHVGENGSAILNINGGTITKTGGQFSISDTGTGGPTGVVNQVAGVVNSTSEFWVGNNQGNGTFNLSGGTFTNSNWFAVGRFGATGTLNVSGGIIAKLGGGNFYIGEGAGVGQFDFTGGLISINSQFWLANGGTSVAVQNMSGSAEMTVANWIAIGRNGGTGTLNLTNGTITKIGGGNFAIGAGGGAVGVLNQYGGLINNSANAGSLTYLAESGGNGTWNLFGGSATVGILQFCQGGNGIGNLHLNGGTLQATEVNCGVNGANGSFYFNGGTLRAGADNPSFFQGLGGAYVEAGGAVIDSQAFTITMAQNLANFGGGLTKLGTGTLTLSGVNNYAGPTLVNAGTLAVTTDATGGGDYSIASAAQLNVKVQSANAQLNMANLTLASPATVVGVDLGNFGNPTAAPLNVTGTLDVNGTVAVNVADTLPQVGQFALIKYGTKTGAGSFAVAALPVGVGAVIVDNTGNNSIDLNITNVNLPRWDGQAGGNWDIGLTTNWVNIGTGLPTYFGQGNAVVLDDNALGTTTVNLVATVNPSIVTFNHSSLNYTLTGTGKISGSTGLNKQGSGIATIVNTGGNNYTGPTVIAAGTLSVTNLANGGLPSAIGAASANPTNLVLAGGALSYAGPQVSIDRGYSVQATNSSIETVSNLTVSGLVTATPLGGFIKSGPAQLTYRTVGSNLLSGASSAGYLVQDGSVMLGGSAGGQTNVIQGERLGLNGVAATATVVLTNTTVAISGNVDLGSVANTTGTLIVNSNSTLTVGSWFVIGDGGDSGGTFTLNDGTANLNNGTLLMGGRPGASSTLNINGGVLNKDGGTIIIAPGNWNSDGLRTGIVNQVSGTVNSSDEIWVGQANYGVGVYNLSGGVLNLHDWLAVGRGGGNGTFNMTGGTFLRDGNGDAFIIAAGGGSVGLFNHSAGTINCSKQYWLAEGGTSVATNNISGTAVVNMGDWASIGRGGLGVINFSGGTINKTGGGHFIVGDNGQGFFNQTGGALTVNNEVWIGQWHDGTGEFTMSAGTLTNNSWFAVGREGGAGVLNLLGGSITKQGGGNVPLCHGHDGNTASAVVNHSGGDFTCLAGELWIGEDTGTAVYNMNAGTASFGWVQIARNSSVTGELNLNGGTFAATEITTGSGPSTLNFNGGTLVARHGANADFLHGLTTAKVLAGGAFINTGTNNVNVSQALLDGTGGGGLTKNGGGTLRLNGANTYTGPTLVNVGTLGGTGTILGPVSVATGASFAPGASLGTLTISNTLSLAAGTSTRVEISLDGGTTNCDLVTGLTGVSYNGALEVSNVGAASLVPGTVFKLFNSAAPGTGNFTSVTFLPAGTGTFNPATGELTVTSSGILKVNSTSLAGNNLILTGEGGLPGSSYSWLTATNAATPNWVTNLTGVFDLTGSFSNALPINASEPARFFRLKTP